MPNTHPEGWCLAWTLIFTINLVVLNLECENLSVVDVFTRYVYAATDHAFQTRLFCKNLSNLHDDMQSETNHLSLCAIRPMLTGWKRSRRNNLHIWQDILRRFLSGRRIWLCRLAYCKRWTIFLWCTSQFEFPLEVASKAFVSILLWCQPRLCCFSSFPYEIEDIYKWDTFRCDLWMCSKVSRRCYECNQWNGSYLRPGLLFIERAFVF